VKSSNLRGDIYMYVCVLYNGIGAVYMCMG
jgi:hypothetical protein